MKRRHVALLTLTTLGALPAPALAQDPAAEPAPAVEPAAPVAGQLSVAAEKVGPRSAVLAGQRFRVRSVLTPAVAGQPITVRLYRGTRRIAVKQLTLQRSATGRSAYAVAGFTVGTPGRITIQASHVGTPELATVRAAPASVDVLPRRAAGRGRAVRVLQQHLDRLGYVVGRRGVFDGRTARAVIALRKNLGMARTASADEAVMRRLARGQGAFPVRFKRHGRHVEADISKQVMALIGEGGKVERIYHISSGAPATPTILGSYRVYRKDFGTNALGMVDAAYFIRGYAIHGYKSVPMFNASHGCLRVPIPDARSISNWLRHGTRVDTYR